MSRKQTGTGTNLLRPRRRGMSVGSKRIIDAAYEFLAEQHPTTVRGVCYPLFNVYRLIASMKAKDTKRVSRLLTIARKDGTILWDWIVEQGRQLDRPSQWSDLGAYLRAVRWSFRRDFWNDQLNRVEVWSEKGTVNGILAPILNEYGVGFRIMRGFGSTTVVHDVAEEAQTDRRPLTALYVGDHDPSGMFMSEVDLPDRLAEHGSLAVDVRRIALLPEDVGGLPSFPAKKSDPRYKWYVKRYGRRAWELDAMRPNDLRARVEAHIKALIEPKAWARGERAQEAEQASLEAFLKRWPKHEGDATP